MDFVLKDPREKEDAEKERLPPHREEMEVVPKPWHKDYVAGLEAMSHNLHITTPCMLQVLDFWHVKVWVSTEDDMSLGEYRGRYVGLHFVTPCMLQVLDFWHVKFG